MLSLYFLFYTYSLFILFYSLMTTIWFHRPDLISTRHLDDISLNPPPNFFKCMYNILFFLLLHFLADLSFHLRSSVPLSPSLYTPFFNCMNSYRGARGWRIDVGVLLFVFQFTQLYHLVCSSLFIIYIGMLSIYYTYLSFKE